MLARLLKWLLLLEALFWLAIGLGLSHAGGLPTEGALVVFFAGPIFLRALWLFGLFVGGLRHTWDKSRVLGFADLAALFFREWTTLIRVYSLLLPLERRMMAHDDLPALPRFARPVILVHGYRCNRAYWRWMREALEARGHAVATLNLEPLLGDIDDYSAQLAARIETVCSTTGAEQVCIIGHSMGALVALAYLRNHGAARVVKFIALGGPFGGSWLARFGSGRSARQMRPGNPWLEALKASDATRGVEVTTIASLHDCYVAPEDARLDQARVRQLAAVGHLEMGWSEPVLQEICEALDYFAS